MYIVHVEMVYKLLCRCCVCVLEEIPGGEMKYMHGSV